MSEDRRSAPIPAPESVSQEAAPAILEPASPLDRALQGGETHTFAVVLAEDQFLDLRVDQRGVDAVVTLLGPRGEPLIAVDNPSGADGARGVERVVWIAKTPGSYGVEIEGRAGKDGAGYTIELEEPRVAEASDRDRVAAEKLKAEADLLYGQGTLESRRQAAGRYQEALAGFLALKDVARQADARYRLAMSWRTQGEKLREFEELEAALSLYEATANEPQQAQCRHQLCYLLIRRNELESALGQCKAALRLWEAVGDRLGTVRTTHELGYVYRRLNEGHLALTLYDRALDLSRELDRPSREAQTRHNRGRFYASLGQRALALADLENALAIRRQLGKERDVAISLNSLGLLHVRWKETDTAIDYFAQALTFRQSMGERRAGISLLGMGWAHLEAGDARSGEYIRQALRIFRQEGSRSWQAQALLFLGQQAGARELPARIPEPLTRALQLFEAQQDLAGTAETRLAIAGAMRRLGWLSEAQTEIEMALEIIEYLRDRVAVNLDQRADFFATKQAYYDFYVDLLMERHEQRPSAGFGVDALAASEQARARSLIEALSEHNGGPRQEVEPALLEEERRLQRQIGSRQVQIEALLADAPAAQGVGVSRLKDEQRDLLRRYKKLQGQIRLQSPQYADLTRPTFLSGKDIQRLLEPDTLMLEYRLGESRSHLWALTVDTIDAVKLPARDEIERAAMTVTRFLSREHSESATRSRRRAEQALDDLSRWLFRDVRSHVAVARRLLIVTDGALQYLPFEALTPAIGDPPEPAELLIAGPSEIVYLPSASALAVLRGRLADREPAPRLLAVVADPVFTADDPRFPRRSGAARSPGTPPVRSGQAAELRRLSYTAAEAEAILGLVPAESRFAALDFEASRDVLTSGELGRHRIVHLATHGVLNAEHAELSRLVLSLFDSQGRRRDDGFLYAYEVYGLDLPAELVVLSACQTALGEQIRGEGLVGLTRGFMHAGAARVIVSLWRVEDQATAALMGRFYENMLLRKMAPAAALRAAKSSIRQEEEWRDPYYWAGFVFQGEWRDFLR